MKLLLTIITFIGLKLWELVLYTIIKPVKWLFTPDNDLLFESPPIIFFPMMGVFIIFVVAIICLEFQTVTCIIASIFTDLTFLDVWRACFAKNHTYHNTLSHCFAISCAGHIIVIVSLAYSKEIKSWAINGIKSNWKKAKSIVGEK